jgi:hypothetical protein
MVEQKLLDKPVPAAGMVSADYLPQK